MRRFVQLRASSILGMALALAGCGDDSASTGGTSSSGGAGGEASTGGHANGGNTGFGGDTTTNNGGANAGGFTGVGGDGGGPPSCLEGTILCEGTLQKVCDGNGGFTETECAPGGCVPGVGCTVCQPGSATCNGDVSTVCKSDGSGYVDYVCDPIQGSACQVATGHCTGTCSPEALGLSYIGCDYFPTVTGNIVAQNFNYAVAVANTSGTAADITVTQGAGTVTTATVAPDSVQVITLPWVFALKDATVSTMAADGAYRLRSTQPVTVYQYSPLEYSQGFSNSYTNDASLLLPTNVWTGNYRVAARNTWHFDQGGGTPYPGLYAVTASHDGTTVTLSPSATGGVILAGGGVPANGAGSVVLNEGDVLQILSGNGGFNPDPYDLTGTLVTADKPVQVIGGSVCSFIPYNIGYCDHLEESMPPIETLATEYIVTPPLIPTGGTTPKAEMVRVIATEANTTISYDPPQAGAPTSLANAGDYFEISQTVADFVVTSNKPVLVSQYMLGQDAGGGSGDPAMALAVATAQYRDDYLFHAPTNYETNYVNITAPLTATITLDGVVVSGFVAIGASGFGVVRVPLSNAGDGNHHVSGDEEFGISVYGYGQYTSYWYPGGLDLKHVN